jgi:hypothetical protein
MDDVQWWARDVDTTVASAARMYDYYLGGAHNFAADREAARQVITAIPEVPMIARANRAFLARAVRHLLSVGVNQFLDIGSGIPTVGNVHEVAQAINPDARVVYVDVDPVAVAHSQQLLAGNGHATAIMADLRQPHELLGLLNQQTVLDLRQPVGLLLVAVLHFVPGDNAYTCVAALRDTLAPGSYLVLSHSSVEGFAQVASDDADAVRGVYQKTATPAGLRNRDQIQRFFDGFGPQDPGLVWVSQWRPDDDLDDLFAGQPQRAGMLAGVGKLIS